MSLISTLPPLNPVFARELKQRMRGRHVWLVLTLYLAVLAAILRFVYVTVSRTDSFDGGFDVLASATAGRAIFQWLLFFMLLLVCFIVPGLTAGAISGERERQTLIALQLTLLRPRSIVIGKLLASLAFVTLLIVASLPLVTVPFLVGGVSVPEVLKGLMMVLATAVTLACLTLACSAILRRTQAATVVAYGVTLAMVLGTLMVYGAQQIPRRFGPDQRPDPWILTLNPFAATAEVVRGRSESNEVGSPFDALSELVRLSNQDRFDQPFPDAFDQPAMPVPFVVGPDGRPMPIPPPMRAPATGVPGLAQEEVIISSGDSGSSSSSEGFVIDQAAVDLEARLGGVRFWIVSLWAWLLLAVAAAALTVRRISLPAGRESR